MLRSFSISLAGHAALIGALLVLASAQPALRVVDLPRAARLVAHLELPAAPALPGPPALPARPPRIEAPEPPRPAARTAPARPAARPAPAREPVAAPAPPRPVAVPKILIPTREEAPPRTAPAPPAAEAVPRLSERLARRLAAAAPPAPAPVRPPEVSPPRSASLPPPERTEPPRPAALPGPRSAAAPASLPAGPVMPLADFPYAWYVALLQERVFGRWNPPSEFYLGGRSAAALVAFRIDRGGRLGRVSLKEGSGYARFDRSAVAAVEGLRDLPPLPEQYREDTLDVVIRFQNRQAEP